jgi:hypothetical protein
VGRTDGFFAIVYLDNISIHLVCPAIRFNSLEQRCAAGVRRNSRKPHVNFWLIT